jgi:hypothetical protein
MGDQGPELDAKSSHFWHEQPALRRRNRLPTPRLIAVNYVPLFGIRYQGRGNVDSGQFDRLAQRVGTGHRRQVLGVALSGIVALVGLPAATESRARKRKLTVEGPCGNGRIKDNRCQRDTQCCTGFCDKKKGKRPYGRCRCRKLNQSCREDRNCCATAGQPMSCVAGTCQTTTSCVPQGGTCGDGTVCCTGLECQAGTCEARGLCVPLGGACTTGGTACCTDLGANATCAAGICRDPGYCTTTLEAAGCGFSVVEMVWFCSGQYLSGVNLSGCDLAGARFPATNLTNAILASTNLTDANFIASDVTGVSWENTTCPTGTNSDANGDTCCGEFILEQVPVGCPAV